MCVQYDQEWGAYKWKICRSHNETNIKINLKVTKVNLSSVKISRKRKQKEKYVIFSTHAFLARRVNLQHANIPFHKSFILINF
jgi:hypothetical protein